MSCVTCEPKSTISTLSWWLTISLWVSVAEAVMGAGFPARQNVGLGHGAAGRNLRHRRSRAVSHRLVRKGATHVSAEAPRPPPQPSPQGGGSFGCASE